MVVNDAAGDDCVRECGGVHLDSIVPSLGLTDAVPLAGNTGALADGTVKERI